VVWRVEISEAIRSYSWLEISPTKHIGPLWLIESLYAAAVAVGDEISQSTRHPFCGNPLFQGMGILSPALLSAVI
jgi:hypothetical protein